MTDNRHNPTRNVCFTSEYQAVLFMKASQTRIKRSPEVMTHVRAVDRTWLSEGTELPKALVSSGPKSS